MRALAVHDDVIVVVSAIWQTTCTLVRSGEEGFVIDSPVLPDELEALSSLAEQARFPVSGLLCTHADWDHLLGRLAFPEASLGAGELAAERLERSLGDAQRRLRDFDAQHYLSRPRPLGLGGVQSLPVPGKLSIGEAGRDIEVHPAPGHTADGVVFLIPWAHTLICGDYLSPVEIPMIAAAGDGDGAVGAYRETLIRLGELITDSIQTVVPGHGAPLSADDARRVLSEDQEYLSLLVERPDDAVLPARRRTRPQAQIHERNRLAVRAAL